MIINAENQILGRLAAFAAKKAMLGEKVDIVNCEKAIITGNKKQVLSHYKQRRARGVPKKGPFIHRMPDRFVRRTIRGMLPYKNSRGSEAFKRVMCHVSIPREFEGKEMITPKGTDVSKLTNLKYIKVYEICKELGANV